MPSPSCKRKLESTRERRPSTGVEARRPMAMETTSWGQAFVESEQFRSYNGHGQSGRFEIEGLPGDRVRRSPRRSLSIPHFVIPPIETTFRSPLLEVVGRVTVSSGVVDWVEIGADPVAAVVAEGAAKPEATFTMTPKTAALDTIAHWVQITRQALEDAPYIRSLIEGKLRRGLLAKAEADMAAAIVAATLPTADRRRPRGGDPRRDRQGRVGRLQPERRRAQPGRLRRPRRRLGGASSTPDRGPRTGVCGWCRHRR